MLKVSAIRKGLEAAPISAAEASRRATGRDDAIKRVFRGHSPSAERLARICHALSLEFYIGPPRDGTTDPCPKLPPGTEGHRWGDRRGKVVTPQEVPFREGHAPERVGFSPNGCAHFGLEFLLMFDLDPEQCEVVEIFDDSMAPELPDGAAGLVDLRKTERVDGCVYALSVPELTVRRARATRHGWVAAADNTAFETFPWADYFAIAGKVVWTSHMLNTEPVMG